MASYECTRCHRIFKRTGSENVCPACAPIDEVEFRLIKEYITEHQGASSSEVVLALGVSLNQIKRYLKEERLEIRGDNKGFIRCETCGKSINSGRLCDNCYKEANAQKMFGVKVNKIEDSKVTDKHKYLREVRYKENKKD